MKRLGIVGLGAAAIYLGREAVTAPNIQLSGSVQAACFSEIEAAVKACREDALGFNTSSDPNSEMFKAKEALRTCLSSQGTSPTMNCSAPDGLFPAHFYVGGYPKAE